MLKKVIIYENPLNFSEFEVFEVEDHLKFLASRWDKWPDTGRIYHGDVSQVTDVTPSDEASIERLAALEGTFHCVIFPGAFLIPYAAYIIAAILFVAALVMMPSIPNVTQRNTQNPSPNNELSSRTNRPRLNGRIPDIYGEVRATPDLIAQTYSTFEDHLETEHALLCLGRGQYEIHDSYDGETPINQIVGTSVEVYYPFDNPITNIDTPYYTVGPAITNEFFNCVRSNSVNGQILRAPNYNRFAGFNDVTFTYPNVISIPSGSGRNFDNYFNNGDTLVIDNADKYESVSVASFSMRMMSATSLEVTTGSVPTGWAVGGFLTLTNCDLNVDDGSGGISWIYHLSGTYQIASLSSGGGVVNVAFVLPHIVNSHWNEYSTYGTSLNGDVNTSANTGAILLSLNGTYSILSVTDTTISLSAPSVVNPDWNLLSGSPFTNTSAVLSADGINWIGPFVLENVTREGIIANFVALSGLYADNGTTQYAIDVEIEIELTPVDLDNNPTGPSETLGVTVEGSSVSKETRAATLDAGTLNSGRCSIRAARTSLSPTGFQGNVVDEVKWRDLYSRSYFENDNFGNVTTVRTKSLATSGALSAKERKLNMLVTRQLYIWLGGTTFTPDLQSTKFAKDIIFNIALDPKIGNRSLSEIDFEDINTNASSVPSVYFGTVRACQFCYTFDKTNLTFEETLSVIATAVYCVPYRLGNVIKFSFEAETEDSTLLFNHRNKLPGSETRTVTFGNQNDNDGIELDYVSPDDDAIVTIYLPADQSAENPKKIETIGVRNYAQAYFHIWRHYNKLRYQNMQVEFEATQEADMCIPTDRILVADNTRSGTQDGQIDNQVGLVVYTSQKLTFSPGVDYTMFLQLYDGTVQAIPVTAGPVAASATLSAPPTLPLVTDGDSYAQTTYILVGNDDVRQKAFLVTEKITQDNMTSKIRAANYDARFYEHDKDYINGDIT